MVPAQHRQEGRADVQLGTGTWGGGATTGVRNADVRTLRFGTAESRRYLVLTLGMVSERTYESVCHTHAQMTVTATSGVTSPVVASNKQPAVIALSGEVPPEFRLALEDDKNCLMDLYVINAVLTDNDPSGIR